LKKSYQPLDSSQVIEDDYLVTSRSIITTPLMSARRSSQLRILAPGGERFSTQALYTPAKSVDRPTTSENEFITQGLLTEAEEQQERRPKTPVVALKGKRTNAEFYPLITGWMNLKTSVIRSTSLMSSSSQLLPKLGGGDNPDDGFFFDIFMEVPFFFFCFRGSTGVFILTVRTFSGKKIQLEVTNSDTILTLKRKIEEKESLN
jgi:hypothetical protein